MLYLQIALLAVILSGILFKKASGTISLYRPHMMSVIFYYYFVLQNAIGAVLVINGVDNHYMIDMLQYQSSRSYGYWAILYTMIMFPIGMLLANSIWKKGKTRISFFSYCRKPLVDEYRYNSHIVKRQLQILSFISGISVLYVLYKIGEIPILKLFSGVSASDFAQFRGEVGRHFAGNEYVKNVFAYFLTPILSYIAYGYKKLENSKTNKMWFYFMFVLSLLIVTYNLAKSPIIVYLFGFLFFEVYMGKRISRKTLLLIVCGGLLLVILLYLLLMGVKGDGLGFLFLYNSGIVGRLTLSSSAGVFFSFDLFPSCYGYLGFSSVSHFLSDMFGLGYSENSARLIMEYINPIGVANDAAGMVNSLFVGESWAAFGFYGVLLSPIYVGFVIQTLFLFILHSPKTPFFVGLFVAYSFPSCILGGFFCYIYNINTVVLVVVILFVYGGSLILSGRSSSTCTNSKL